MKITICGKGGSGKSTITALLARALAREGRRVLVIDSDESNYGLARQLGMQPPQDFTAYFGGKQRALEDMLISNFTHQFFDGRWGLADIPEGYASEDGGVLLMVSGKIRAANEGCACAMGNVLEQFLAHLDLKPDEFALMDMEAGVEHFGRGIDGGADAILMIVDPSYESLALSQKVLELARSISKPAYFALNRVDGESREAMRAGLCDGAELICELPADPTLRRDGLLGRALRQEPEEIRALARFFLKLAARS